MINVLFAVIIVVLIAADQVTKYIMLSWLKPIETFELIPGFLRFHYVENDGAAFSMLRNARWFFIIVTVVCVWAYALWRCLTKMRAVAFPHSAALF